MPLKGGEMKVMLSFCIWLLVKHGGRRYIRACLAGDNHPVMPDVEGLTKIRALFHNRMQCLKVAEISFTPKHHLACHMVDRSPAWNSNG